MCRLFECDVQSGHLNTTNRFHYIDTTILDTTILDTTKHYKCHNHGTIDIVTIPTITVNGPPKYK